MQTNNDTLKRYYSKKKKRKQRRKFAFYTLLTVFFVFLVTILSLTVFFNISEITVTGNSYYTKEQLISQSGLQKGQNLFRLNKFKIIENMKKSMPYLAQVVIDRHLPVSIEICVTETKGYLVAAVGSEYYVLDENLKILEKKTDITDLSLPVIEGIVPTTTNIGEVMTDENGVCSRLLALTGSLKKIIGDDCVTKIDVATSFDLSFDYMDRITVKLGTAEKIEKKLELVKYVIDDNRANDTAIIDASSGEKAYYRHDDRTEPEPEPEPEQEPEQNEQTEQEPEQNETENQENN